MAELFHKAAPIVEGAWSAELRDDYLALRELVVGDQDFVVFKEAEKERLAAEGRMLVVRLQTETTRAMAFLEQLILQDFSSPSALKAISLVRSLKAVVSSQDPERLQAGMATFSGFIADEELQEKLALWQSEVGDMLVAEPAAVLPDPELAEADREKPSETAAGKAPAKENRNAVAVIIGNRNYEGNGVPRVDFAHNDADAIRRYVIEALGYRDGNIIDVRDATMAELVDVFGSRDSHAGKLSDYVRAGQSDVTVFYSGHGVPGLDDLKGYLLPVDANPNRVALTGYPIDLLFSNLSKIDARSMTVYLDACFSGDSPKGMIVRATSGISVTPRLPDATKQMVVITAARGDQYASWDEEAEFGLFTRYLLEGLRGAADGEGYGNGDDQVTLAEVTAYLDDEMTYQARRRYARKQNVSVQGDPDTVLVTHQH